MDFERTMKTTISNMVFGLLLAVMVCGCAIAPPKRPITELYASLSDPGYDFTPAQAQGTPAGYTVGIINMDLDVVCIPQKALSVTELGKQYLGNFIGGFNTGFEKILTSKGITVSGPFESYDEMTYPERSRCDFLIQPCAKVTFQPLATPVQRLNDRGGPNGESWVMGASDTCLKVKAELEYVILDPLTQEKLERHRLKTDTVSVDFRKIYCKYTTRDDKGKVIKEEWREITFDQSFPGYHNEDVAVGQILDQLYSEFMPKIDGLVSVAEFDHLKKFQEELKEKKVY